MMAAMEGSIIEERIILFALRLKRAQPVIKHFMGRVLASN